MEIDMHGKTRQLGARFLLPTIAFVAGGLILPHVQVRWTGANAAAARAGDDTSLTSWARNQPVAVAAEKCAGAVVNIDTVSTVRQSWGFFGEYTRLVPEKGAGSGVIISPEGYILTNDHVIRGANRINVTLANGKTLNGRLVGSDHQTDIAVVKIPGGQYPAATLGDSNHLRPGEWAIAEGNPLGTFSHTVSLGVVSALGRNLTIGDRTYDDLLQTDAAINPGNSGGPLLNINGAVIGINTATVSSAQGISFAIPINTANSIAQQLIQYGKIKRPWTGLQLADILPSAARAYGIDPTGAVVIGVDQNSPADQADFQQGDIIRKVNNQVVHNSNELQKYLNAQPIGASVNLLVERDNEQQTVTLKLEQEPQ
jgi:serine protease Do